MTYGAIRAFEPVTLSPAWRNPVHTGAKRLIDSLGAIVLLVILSPVLILLGIAVKLSSSGPVLYRWRVVGQGGRPFVGYKFRSMLVNADNIKEQLLRLNEMQGPVFKLTNDPRITKLGAWMRKYSLDELPQLFSVLNGDMSLVGPRPPLQTEYAQFSDFQKQKLAVKPGITCLWQVNGRNEIVNFDDWVKLDLEYIRTWSLWLDFKILLKTAAAVVVGSGK